MAFASQFSLSLELTRLIPLCLEVAGKTYEAAMSLARDLQVKLFLYRFYFSFRIFQWVLVLFLTNVEFWVRYCSGGGSHCNVRTITDFKADGFYLSHNRLKIKSSTEALRRNSFM